MAAGIISRTPVAPCRRCFLSVSAEKLIFISLLILYLAPLWVFRYIPTQDGPSHLANAEIIKKYNDPDADRIRQYYKTNRALVTNFLYHYVLAGLLHIFRPLVAEKVILSVYVILFALAARALTTAVNGRPTPVAFLLFPVTYSYLFHMGFFAYTFSLAVAMLGLAYYWRGRERTTVKRFVVLNLFAFVAAFFHLFGAFFLVGGVLLLTWLKETHLVLYKVKVNKESISPCRLAATLATPLYFTPVVALALFHCLHTRASPKVGFREVGFLFSYISRGVVLHAIHETQGWLAVVITVVLAVALAWALGAVVFRRLRRRFGAWKLSSGIYWPWGVLALTVTAAYFLAPDIAMGGAFISDRLALLLLITFVAYIAGTARRILRGVLYIAAPALAVAYVSTVFVGFREANEDLKEFNSGRCAIHEKAMILPIVTVNLPKRGCRVNYMEHAASYYTLGTYSVDVWNYEAFTGYFPVVSRSLSPPVDCYVVRNGTPVPSFDGAYEEIDYVICWSINPFLAEMREVFARYEVVHAKRRLMILRRRGLPPPDTVLPPPA